MKRVYQISVLVSVLALSMVSCTYDFLPPLGEDCDEDEYDELTGDTMGKMPGMWEWIYSIGPVAQNIIIFATLHPKQRATPYP